MDAIKQWMICIVICSVVAAIVYLLSSDSSTKRAIKTVVSVFMICAFLSPFVGGLTLKTDEKILDFSSREDELEKKISEELLVYAKTEAEEKIAKLMKGLNIESFSSDVTVDVNDKNEIYISSVSLEIDKRYFAKMKQIQSNIKEMFGTEAEFNWTKK